MSASLAVTRKSQVEKFESPRKGGGRGPPADRAPPRGPPCAAAQSCPHTRRARELRASRAAGRAAPRPPARPGRGDGGRGGGRGGLLVQLTSEGPAQPPSEI